MAQYPDNRLVQHLMGNCVLRYACPAARNLCLGRYEAPLPVSRVCNARCVGCISFKDEESTICATPQDRLTFTPTVEELVEVMFHHQRNEPDPIYSFGQGCEGEPLTEEELLVDTVRTFRERGGTGTVNLNSNASRPDAVARLGDAGLSSLRVSMNSARPEVHARYYRPGASPLPMCAAPFWKRDDAACLFPSICCIFRALPTGEEEIAALIELVNACDVNFIQLRNLNIDPELYLRLLDGIAFGPAVGLVNFRKRLKKACPGLNFGYFNPHVDANCKDMPGRFHPLPGRD